MANLASRAQNAVGKAVVKAHSSVYRATGGKFVGTMGDGRPILLLNTIGRKSGEKRTHPLLYLADGEDMVIVASAGGAPRHPAWYWNLKANPETMVEVGDREVRVRAEEASPEERARLWPRLVEMYSGYGNYQKKTDREIPVVVLHPVGG